MSKSNDAPDIDALLRHLGGGHDLGNFPGAATQKVALVRTASARGLITWSRARARYELTHSGRNELAPRRGFGAASLMMSAAIGGIVGAAGLGIFWLPGDAPHRSVHARLSPSISRLEKPSVLQVSGSAGVATPSSAAPGAVNVLPDAQPEVTADPKSSETPELEPRNVADQPAPDQPRAEASVTGVKQTSAKKPRHKTAHHRRREQGASWAYAGSWRGQQFRYAGFGDRATWLGYR